VSDTGYLSSPVIILFLLCRSPKIHNLNTSEHHIATGRVCCLLYVVLVPSCFVLYFGFLSAPNSIYSTVGERCLRFCFVVPTFGNPCLGLLSAPNSMYSTVGKRCLRFCFVVPTFGNPCLGLLSGPNSTVHYCWRVVSLFSFCCPHFRESLSRFVFRSQQ
jgi:hypothetical protein